MNLVFSSVFESDFAELAGYFHEQGVSAKFEDSLCRLAILLRKTPELGRLRRDLQPAGVRSFVVPDFRNYVLFHQISGKDLIFLRVRFGGMDLPSLFHS